jgi:hypothetical protein
LCVFWNWIMVGGFYYHQSQITTVSCEKMETCSQVQVQKDRWVLDTCLN